MTHLLKYRYDDRDFLEMWLLEFDSESNFDLESGLYEYANTARLQGSNRAFDSIMVDAFSKAYSDIIDEVKRKEPPVESDCFSYLATLRAFARTQRPQFLQAQKLLAIINPNLNLTS